MKSSAICMTDLQWELHQPVTTCSMSALRCPTCANFLDFSEVGMPFIYFCEHCQHFCCFASPSCSIHLLPSLGHVSIIVCHNPVNLFLNSATTCISGDTAKLRNSSLSHQDAFGVARNILLEPQSLPVSICFLTHILVSSDVRV